MATRKIEIENVTHVIFLLNISATGDLAWSPDLVHSLFLYILKAQKSFYIFKGCFLRSCYRDYVWPAKVKVFTILPFIYFFILPFIEKVCLPTLSPFLMGFGAIVIPQSWTHYQKNHAWNFPINLHIPTIVLNVGKMRRAFQKEKERIIQTPWWYSFSSCLTYSSRKLPDSANFRFLFPS